MTPPPESRTTPEIDAVDWADAPGGLAIARSKKTHVHHEAARTIRPSPHAIQTCSPLPRGRSPAHMGKRTLDRGPECTVELGRGQSDCADKNVRSVVFGL